MYEDNDFKSEGISCACNIFWGCLDEEGQFKGMIDAWRIFWPFSHQSFARALVMDLKWIMQKLIIWMHSLQFLLLLLLYSEITDEKQYAMLWLTQNMSFLEYLQFKSNQRQETENGITKVKQDNTSQAEDDGVRSRSSANYRHLHVNLSLQTPFIVCEDPGNIVKSIFPVLKQTSKVSQVLCMLEVHISSHWC